MSDFEDRVRDELHQLAESAEPAPTLRQQIDARLGTGPPPMGRPPVALAAVAAAIVLVAAALVVLSARGHGGGHKLVLTQGTSTTAGPTSTLAAAPGVSSVTPTSAPPVSDSTTAAPTTTATSVGATTTTGATTTVGPTTTVAVVDCATGDLQTRTATDKPGYTSGETVTITVTVKNVSARRCQIESPMPNPFADAVTINALNNPATPVWQPARLANGTVVNVDPRPLAPNESYTWATVQWKQDLCVSPCAERAGSNPPRVPVPAIYQASPLNAPGVAAPASFLLQGP